MASLFERINTFSLRFSMEEDGSQLLHSYHVSTKVVIFNRLHILVHAIAILILIHYRASYFFQESTTRETPIFLWSFMFSCELLLSFLWFLDQAFRWRPIHRTAYPERLPEDGKLPSIDVFICTADPGKEPTFEVMNTVVSAMALNYSPEKLNVYLSDDAGSHLTLQGMREAWRFARSWLPFCRTYGIKTRCPQAYFSDLKEDENHAKLQGPKFIEDAGDMEEKYRIFKENIGRARQNDGLIDHENSKGDHPPTVEVINDKETKTMQTLGQAEMPRLVYVSREKRPFYPHHFKAGALNVLFRVSGLISNSPYVLVLDCDMYCNDPDSARRAMCFHLDPKISSSLAFVQFPQMFHNISQNDIYDSSIRGTSKIMWPGVDGIQGAMLCGSGFYIKRDALYVPSISTKGIELKELKQVFGSSNEFIKSLNLMKNEVVGHDSSIALAPKELELVATCTYEEQTKWGQEIGFYYGSVVEDFFTGFMLHCKGWKSVYCYPSTPQFLGSGTTGLNVYLTQNTRWMTGLLEVGLSKFCPLIYGFGKMSYLRCMCHGNIALLSLNCIPIWFFATIPQLCLLNNIPLYPKVSNSLFLVFLFLFMSSLLRHLQEVLVTGGSIRSWKNEQRMWMVRSTTSYLYGTIDFLQKAIGLRETSFMPTNKVEDSEQLKLYQLGIYNFEASIAFVVPLVLFVIVNMASFVVGVLRIITTGDFESMLTQWFLSFFILLMGYPVFEGMVLRKDKGRVRPYVTVLSLIFSIIFLSLGSLL